MKRSRHVFGAVALAVCILANPISAKTPANILVVAKNIDDIISLDPAQAYEPTSGEIVANIYDRLIRYDPEDMSRLQPSLARSWVISPDGKTVTFKLREDVKFASGNPVRPEDIVFSFKRVIALKKAPASIIAQLGWTAENVDLMVRKISSDEVAVTVTESLAPSFVLNALAARPGSIVDEVEAMKNAKGGDLGNEWLARNSAGSGPYSLRAWRPGEGVTLEANRTHFRGAPKLRQVVLRHVAKPARSACSWKMATWTLRATSGPIRSLGWKASPGLRSRTTLRPRFISSASTSSTTS